VTIAIELAEWQTVGPDSMPQLRGLSFDGQPAARTLAEKLSREPLVALAELRKGLEIRTTSYVGNVTLGDVAINIRPKIAFDVLVTLFRYAYGLHDLQLFPEGEHNREVATFQDLLIHQLAVETAKLIDRGVFRQYRPHGEYLASPRGRIDVRQIVRNAGVHDATVPCVYFERSDDNPLNRAIVAGLRHAATLTGDLVLRARLRRQAGMLELTVARHRLTSDLLDEAHRSLTRLNLVYSPVLRLISLLFAGTAITFDGDEQLETRVPGFLFDMNRFFEQLIARFLRDSLPDYEVKEQHRLTDMMSYRVGSNPKNRRSPVPRPDIALLRGGKLVGLFDTKYRDLWETPLPRDMLYQLAIYALSQGERRAATILYPTTSPAAKEQVIDIREPIFGATRAAITLRPIDMASLAKAVAMPGMEGERRRSRLASGLVNEQLAGLSHV